MIFVQEICLLQKHAFSNISLSCPVAKCSNNSQQQRETERKTRFYLQIKAENQKTQRKEKKRKKTGFKNLLQNVTNIVLSNIF